MSFAADLLADLDGIRGIPGELGLRPYRVTVRVRTWIGGRPNQGTKTDVDTVLTVAGGRQNPKVRQLTSQDVIASGGLYTAENYRIGPMTPAYLGGGVDYATVDPPTTTTAREVFFRIEGAEFPAGGAWFVRVGDEITSLHINVIVKKAGFTP